MKNYNEKIALKVTNKTGVIQPIELFGSPQSDFNNAIGQDDLIAYDLSTEDFTGTTVTFTVNFQTFNPSGNPNSVGDVVRILNTLSIALFYNVGTTIYATNKTLPNFGTSVLTIA